MNVSQLMQHRVMTVRTTESLLAAAMQLRAHDCGCVVVVDEERRPVGVVTDRDICIAAERTGRTLGAIRVADAMSEHPFTCRGDDAIVAAEQTMSLHQVRRLPVVDAEQRLVGLLALDDIAREACREEGLLAPPVSCAAVGRTLGQIVRPHLVSDTGQRVRS